MTRDEGNKTRSTEEEKKEEGIGNPRVLEYKTSFETYLEANTRYVQSPPTRMHHLN